MRGMSSYGQMEVACALNLPEPCFVDADTFITILGSLPSEPLSFTLTEGVLTGSAGAPRVSWRRFRAAGQEHPDHEAV